MISITDENRYSLEAELLRRDCRKNYHTYVEFANPGFCMTKFHRYLCDEIQEFLDTPTNKALDILLLSVPPQHGKSFTVTETLPSWFLGRQPDASVILASYESGFAEAFSRRNRDKFNLYAQEVFLQYDENGTCIHNCKPNKNVQGVGLWETEVGGRCRGAGLKAGITGHGAELFIIDDPIKSKEQADSEAVITKIHDEMGPSVQSRIHPGGKLIVIQTRWVENDVIGWIQENWEEYIWKTINLPAEYDEEAAELGPDPLGRKLGDSLMGEHLGDMNIPQKIRNDNNWLRSKKPLVIASDGDRTWNALYQGRPSAASGNLYHPNSWKKFKRTPELLQSMEYIELSVDATFKNTETSDFVAMEMWCLKGRNAYLWKLKNKRMGFVNTLAEIRKVAAEFPMIDELIIEDKANGSAILDVLRYDESVPPVVGIEPRGGKYARAQATTQYVESGAVYVPDDFTEEEAKDVEWDGKTDMTVREKFIKQHSSFPFAKRDDMVDAQTQAISRIMKLITGELPMPEKRYTKYSLWTDDMYEDYESLSEEEQAVYINKYGAPAEWAPDEYWENNINKIDPRMMVSRLRGDRYEY